jgi:hypothetical protein
MIGILLLAGMLNWRELCTRVSAPFGALIVASAVAWTILALSNPEWLASLEAPWGGKHQLLLLAYEFLKVPDLLGVVAVPWARSAPVLGAMLLGILGFASLRIVAMGDQPLRDERVILLLIVCLLAGASMSGPPRFETRYVFFLYPAAILVVVATVARAVAQTPISMPFTSLATALIVAEGLYLSGDLQPRRLLSIDTAESNFAKATATGSYSNILRRSDPRGAAQWLAANAGAPGTALVNGYPGVDYYFQKFDFAYIDKENQRYEAYACNRGTVERWGNLPLLSSAEELDSKTADSERVLIVVDTPSLKELLRRLAARRPIVAWTSVDGYISIIDIAKPPAKD